MPKFELISESEALTKTATGKRAQLLQEYLGYIEQLKPGTAGKLEPAQGETATAVRRRLNAAAKAANKDLVVRRVGEEIIFWLHGPGRRRRARPRRAAA